MSAIIALRSRTYEFHKSGWYGPPYGRFVGASHEETIGHDGRPEVLAGIIVQPLPLPLLP